MWSSPLAENVLLFRRWFHFYLNNDEFFHSLQFFMVLYQAVIKSCSSPQKNNAKLNTSVARAKETEDNGLQM